MASGHASYHSAAERAAKQQAAEDAALQTAIMLSLADAGHLTGATSVGSAAPDGMVKRRPTTE